MASGIPLAFTQEDFLVSCSFCPSVNVASELAYSRQTKANYFSFFVWRLFFHLSRFYSRFRLVKHSLSRVSFQSVQF